MTLMRDDFRVKVRRTLSAFKKNSGVLKAMTHFYLKLMDSNLGRSIKVFQRWKSMPERSNDQKIINTNKFERKLTALHTRGVRTSFSLLKDQLLIGEGLKKSAVRTLLIKTMSSEKRLFLSWINTVRTEK